MAQRERERERGRHTPGWDFFLCLSDEVDKAGEVDKELADDGEDGVQVEDVWQRTLLRQHRERLGTSSKREDY